MPELWTGVGKIVVFLWQTFQRFFARNHLDQHCFLIIKNCAMNFFDKLSVIASKVEKQPPMAMSEQEKALNYEIDGQIKGISVFIFLVETPELSFNDCARVVPFK